MRLLLVGAFRYPWPQGTQAYFGEQASALRAAGCDISLLSYGAASRPQPPGTLAPPPWLMPRSARSGPRPAKLVADVALAMTLRQTVASRSRADRYDAILTHHVEATWAAALALPRRRPPIVYCAHTLLEEELATYSKSLQSKELSTPPTEIWPAMTQARHASFARVLSTLGSWGDAAAARHSAAWIALTHASSCVMKAASDQPGCVIRPPVADPLETLRCDPLLTKLGLERDRFLVYAGNLDAYQELDLLLAACRSLPPAALPVVIATHDDRMRELARRAPNGVRCVESEDAGEVSELLRAARGSIITRRVLGGFPIKLANSLACATPPIAFLDREWGLRDGVDALIADERNPVRSLAAAMTRLMTDDDLARRLAAGARALYEKQHRPDRVAEQTLALLGSLRAPQPAARRSAGVAWSAAGPRPSRPFAERTKPSASSNRSLIG